MLKHVKDILEVPVLLADGTHGNMKLSWVDEDDLIDITKGEFSCGFCVQFEIGLAGLSPLVGVFSGRDAFRLMYRIKEFKDDILSEQENFYQKEKNENDN